MNSQESIRWNAKRSANFQDSVRSTRSALGELGEPRSGPDYEILGRYALLKNRLNPADHWDRCLGGMP